MENFYILDIKNGYFCYNFQQIVISNEYHNILYLRDFEYSRLIENFLITRVVKNISKSL